MDTSTALHTNKRVSITSVLHRLLTERALLRLLIDNLLKMINPRL